MRSKSTNATTLAVTAATSATSLAVTSNHTGREGVSVYYDGAATLYLLAGEGTVSASLYTVKLGGSALTYWEAPAGFVGALTGLWTAADASTALVTEYV